MSNTSTFPGLAEALKRFENTFGSCDGIPPIDHGFVVRMVQLILTTSRKTGKKEAFKQILSHPELVEREDAWIYRAFFRFFEDERAFPSTRFLTYTGRFGQIFVTLRGVGAEFIFDPLPYGHAKYFGKARRGFVADEVFMDVRREAERESERLWFEKNNLTQIPSAEDDARSIRQWYRRHVAHFSRAFTHASAKDIERWYRMSDERTLRFTPTRLHAVVSELGRLASEGKKPRKKVRTAQLKLL